MTTIDTKAQMQIKAKMKSYIFFIIGETPGSPCVIRSSDNEYGSEMPFMTNAEAYEKALEWFEDCGENEHVEMFGYDIDTDNWTCHTVISSKA